MAIRGLHIEGFGHFYDWSIPDLRDGVTVLVGPNEAGKSTLTRFMLYVLFGPPRSAPPWALAGGRGGGWVDLEGRDGPLRVERFVHAEPVVRYATGATAVGSEAVQLALGGVDRSLYQAVYSFALHDLASFDKLGEPALRDRLFTGALAGAGRSVAEAEAALNRRLTALWRPRAACRIGDAQEREGQLARELEGAKQVAQRFQDEARKLADLGATREGAQARGAAAAREQARLDAFLRALPLHLDAERARRALDAAPVGLAVAPELSGAVVALDIELAKQGASLDTARRRAVEARAAWEGAPAPSAWSSTAARVDALAPGLAAWSDASRAAREAAVGDAWRRLAAVAAEVGWADPRAASGVDLSLGSRQRLERAADAVIEASRARSTADDARRAAERARAIADEASAALASMPRDEAAAALDDAVRLAVADQPRRARLQQRAASLGPRVHDLAREVERLSLAVGDGADGVTLDAAQHAAFAEQHAGHLRRREVARGKLAQDEELLARCARASEEAAARVLELERAGREGAPVDLESLDAFEAAVAAHDAAGAAAVERDARQDAAARGLSDLGAPWTLDRAACAQVDAGARESIRGAARAVTRAREEEERAKGDLERAKADLERARASERENGATLTIVEIEASVDALDQAEAALRDAREAGAPAGASPALLRGGLFALGLVALVVAAWLGVIGVAAAAAAVALLGTAVIAVAVWGLAPPPVARGERGDPIDLTALWARAGLAPSATPADVVRRRGELRHAHRAAQERVRVGEKQRHAAEASARAIEASQAWEAEARRRGWPEGIDSDLVDAWVSGLIMVQAASRDATRSEALRAERDAVWQAWRARAAAAAGPVVGPTLGEVSAARAWVRSERARHERATQAAGALDTARGDLARAEQARIAAQGVRVDAEGALRRIAAEEEAFRAQLDALGVPPRVSFDAGPAWLGMVLDRRRAGDELASLSLDLEATQVEARDAEEAARRVTEALGLTEPDALSAASSRVTRALGVERAFADAAREAARWTVDAERAERSALDAAAAAVVDPGVEDAWRQALASAGLPAIEGSSWRSLEPVVQRAIAEASALGERERELDAWDRGAVAWREEVAACCAAIGHPAPSDLAAARDVAASAQEARRSDALRASLRARLFADLEHAEGEVAKLEAARADLRAQLSALLERVGVPDPATLKARHAEAEDWGRARDAWHAAVAARDAALGDWIVDAGGFEGWSPERAEGWRIEADHAAREASEARARADACLQDITRLETALGTTKGSARVAELEADLASVRAELRGLRRELVEVALAIQLLRQTLQRFREAHQPRILQRAGEFLAIATDGVYVSIQASGDALEVRDAMGGVRGAAELSTGTAELLYLVLRLGLALELSAQHATLPLVLDDVLVNLDPERAEALARVLADVGRHQQLLVLSCRPETAELLQRVASAEVRTLPRFAGRSSPVVGVAPVASAAPTSGGLAPATSRVLEVLRTRAEPMSRREIQEAAGLPDDVCVAAIRELRQGGFIHQIGAARGARYGVGPG